MAVATPTIISNRWLKRLGFYAILGMPRRSWDFHVSALHVDFFSSVTRIDPTRIGPAREESGKIDSPPGFDYLPNLRLYSIDETRRLAAAMMKVGTRGRASL